MGCRIRVIAPHDDRVVAEDETRGYSIQHFKYFFPTKFQSLAYRGGFVSRIRNNGLRLLQLPFFLSSFFYHALRSGRRSELIHAYWSLAGCIGVAVKLLRNRPVVVTLWGSDILLTKFPLFRILFRCWINRADAIVCENTQFSEQLQSLGIPEDRIAVIPNGVDFQLYQPLDKSEARSELNLAADKILVLCVASLIPGKGQRYLIEALPEIQKRVGGIECIFIGEGEDRAELESLTGQLGLNRHVTFAGIQPTDRMPKWFSAADIFVLPSLSEGSPNALLEAMACGLPAVATTVGNIPGIIRNEVDGLLVPPHSCKDLARQILSLIEDPSLAKRLGKEARKTVRARYRNWNDQAESLKQVYERAISAASRSRR